MSMFAIDDKVTVCDYLSDMCVLVNDRTFLGRHECLWCLVTVMKPTNVFELDTLHSTQ